MSTNDTFEYEFFVEYLRYSIDPRDMNLVDMWGSGRVYGVSGINPITFTMAYRECDFSNISLFKENNSYIITINPSDGLITPVALAHAGSKGFEILVSADSRPKSDGGELAYEIRSLLCRFTKSVA